MPLIGKSTKPLLFSKAALLVFASADYKLIHIDRQGLALAQNELIMRSQDGDKVPLNYVTSCREQIHFPPDGDTNISQNSNKTRSRGNSNHYFILLVDTTTTTEQM